MPENVSLLNSLINQPSPIVNPNNLTAAQAPVVSGATPNDTAMAPIDLQSALQSILQQQSQQAPQPSLLQRILSAAGQGLSVGLSNDPGQALAQQLAQIQQKAQLEQERRDKLNNIITTFKLQDLNNQIAEQRQVRAEQRGQASEIEKEKRLFGFEKQKQQTGFENEKNLEALRFDNAKQLASTNFVNGKELENLRSSNNTEERKQATYYETAYPLLFSGLFSDKEVDKLSKSVASGVSDPITIEALGKANKKLRDQKFQQELALRRAMHQGTGASKAESLAEQAERFAISQASQNQLGKDASGNVQELVKGIDGTLKLPNGQTPAQYLGLSDRVDYYRSQMKRFSNASPVVTPNPDSDYKTKAVNSYMQQVKAMQSAGKSNTEIQQLLEEQQKNHPNDSEALQIVRTNLLNETTENSKPGVVSKLANLFNPIAAVNRENAEEKANPQPSKPGFFSTIIEATKKKTPEQNKQDLENYRKRTQNKE